MKIDKRYTDYLGARHGKLTCIKNLGNSNFLWKCDCGNEIVVKSYKIHYKKSCGCLLKETALKRAYNQRSYDTVTLSQEYTNHRGNAKSKGFSFLAKEDWLKIVKTPCYYCGEIDIRNRATMDSYKRLRGVTLKPSDVEKYAVQMNGVDRVDSSKGYELNNVVSCCSMCNRMKNGYSLDSFFNKLVKIYNKHNLGAKEL